ncbi:MAG TPA: efflux RND transporter permease subunit, partial [Candidatus Baltobacteraceae bacterium]|nr:efflux RND transporter permease subunit [Candidatus Baltobacteraceae bacterium]
ISQNRSVMPAFADAQSMVVTPTSEVVIAYALRSNNLSQTVLHELAQQTLVPQFYGIPGLGRIAVMGGPEREYHVRLNPASLAEHGLTANDVVRAISVANDITAVGVAQQYYQRQVLVVNSSVRDLRQLAALSLPDANHTPVTLGSLGEISQGVAPETMQASYDAQHAAIMNFYSLPGADAVAMASAIKDRMKRIAARAPEGMRIERAWDQTDLVVESQRSLRDAILLGAALAILVILLFLRDWRMTLVAALVIPVAMALAVLCMHLTGETLNLMSVGGLAVAVGLIIDDAIVVVENVARHVREGREKTARDAVAAAMRELAAPMIVSTVTIVVVFVPLVLLTGIAGFFFRSLAFTLAEALIVSLALALLLAPALARLIVRVPSGGEHRPETFKHAGVYERILQLALRRRPLVYAASAVVLVVTGLLFVRLPNDFLPQLDEGQLQIDYHMPVGTTLQASDAAATQIERIVMQDPAVVSVIRLTGEDPNGFSPIQVREGKLRIRLRPQNERAGYEVVSDRLRDRLSAALPAADLEFTQLLEEVLGDLSGEARPIMITLSGQDQDTLVHLADGLAERLGKVPGVTDVLSGVQYDDPTQRLSPNLQRLSSLGVTQTDFSQTVQARMQGVVATQVAQQNLSIPVRVSEEGGLAPLQSVSSLEAPRLTTDVSDINGQRTITVTAGNSQDLSKTMAGVQAVLKANPLPPGYAATIGGAYRDQQRSFREFAEVLAIAVVFVFFVMLAAFRSFRLPLVILTAIPLALIGVAGALFLTSTPLNVSSLMGLLLLVGIVVKNGVLLIDAANRRREDGAGVEEALLAAGRMRLRPIVMTTFAAIGGLLPLAFGFGAGAAMEKPLAIAVIGGLSTATAFTLVVIPVLYAGVASLKPQRETETGPARRTAASV